MNTVSRKRLFLPFLPISNRDDSLCPDSPHQIHQQLLFAGSTTYQHTAGRLTQSLRRPEKAFPLWTKNSIDSMQVRGASSRSIQQMALDTSLDCNSDSRRPFDHLRKVIRSKVTLFSLFWLDSLTSSRFHRLPNSWLLRSKKKNIHTANVDQLYLFRDAKR